VNEQQPDPPADDDLSDPAASHGSDLDPRIDSDEDQPEQTRAPTEPASDRGGHLRVRDRGGR
jgi:hypothetical protein